MYRLVGVSHVRCGETDGIEYFLVPPELTEEEIDEAVDNIVAEMIADAKAIQTAPENPGWLSQKEYEKYPDKTIGEVKAEFEAKMKVFKEWKAENDHLSRSFYKRAQEVGFLGLYEATEKEETGAYTSDAYYGHNHGLSLNYKMWEPIG